MCKKLCTDCKHCELRVGYMFCKQDDTAYLDVAPCKYFEEKDPMVSLVNALKTFEVKE